MGVFSVVLFGEGLDRFYESVSFLSAASARGEKGILFLRGPALNAFVSEKWLTPEGTHEAMYSFQHKRPAAFLKKLRSQNAVAVYACSAWVRLSNLPPQRVAERVDAVVGLNAFLSQAQGGPILSF